MNFIKIIRERKIIRGSLYRRYFIDSKGNAVGIPIGVTQLKSKGYSYIANVGSQTATQSKFGSYMIPYSDAATQEAAYLQIIKIIDTLSCNRNPTAPKADKYKVRKDDADFYGFDKSTLPSGVSLHYYDKLNRVTINVCYFNDTKNKFINKSIYVGTRNTWPDRFSTALAQAVELRQSSLTKYNDLTNHEHTETTTA